MSFAPGVLDDFSSRIPVRAGDVLGLRTTAPTNACAFRAGTAVGDNAGYDSGTDPLAGDVRTFFILPGDPGMRRLNIGGDTGARCRSGRIRRRNSGPVRERRLDSGGMRNGPAPDRPAPDQDHQGRAEQDRQGPRSGSSSAPTIPARPSSASAIRSPSRPCTSPTRGQAPRRGQAQVPGPCDRRVGQPRPDAREGQVQGCGRLARWTGSGYRSA